MLSSDYAQLAAEISTHRAELDALVSHVGGLRAELRQLGDGLRRSNESWAAMEVAHLQALEATQGALMQVLGGGTPYSRGSSEQSCRRTRTSAKHSTTPQSQRTHTPDAARGGSVGELGERCVRRGVCVVCVRYVCGMCVMCVMCAVCAVCAVCVLSGCYVRVMGALCVPYVCYVCVMCVLRVWYVVVCG